MRISNLIAGVGCAIAVGLCADISRNVIDSLTRFLYVGLAGLCGVMCLANLWAANLTRKR